MQIRSKFVVTVVSLWSAVGCGDDDGGGSGVASNKKVGDLSASEARSLCNSLKTRTDKISEETKALTCTVTGVFGANGDQAKCEASRSQCESAADDNEDGIDCSDTSGNVTTDCKDVTVGEITGCYDALEDAIKQASAQVSCASKIGDVSGVATSMQTPEACKALQAKCPDAADMTGP